MINLDQVRTLEWKVKQAVQLIGHLRKENDTLRSRLSDTEVRLQELESSLETFKVNQSEMESGIRSALEELEHLEAAPAAPVQADRPAAAPAIAFAAEEPAGQASAGHSVVEAPEAEPEGAAAPAEEVAAPAESAPAEDDFDAEFARLEAEEAARSVGTAPVDPEPEVPDSVELEADPTPEETGLFDEPAPAAPAEDDRRPEQPGLGIF